MRACACGERTMAAWWTLAHGVRSSMKSPRPLSSRASSTRFTGCPIQLREVTDRSAPRVLRRPLLEEPRDTLRVVVVGPQPRVGLALEPEARLQLRLRPALAQPLERSEGQED